MGCLVWRFDKFGCDLDDGKISIEDVFGYVLGLGGCWNLMLFSGVLVRIIMRMGSLC